MGPSLKNVWHPKFRKLLIILLILNTLIFSLTATYIYLLHFPGRNTDKNLCQHFHHNVAYYSLKFTNSSYFKKRIIEHGKASEVTNRKKNIMVMAPVISGFNFIRKHKCMAKCAIHTRIADVTLADAIVIPPRILWKKYKNISFPAYRHPDQYWVFYNRDQPYSIRYHKFPTNLRSFNLTMTWRPDGDVQIGYGYVKRIKKQTRPVSMNDVMASKTGLVAWVVSHCGMYSKRDLYAEELSKYISVDIYGKCGNLTCPRKPSPTCFDFIGKHYKFYLAFENNICDGYVTEKIFRTLQMNIVPIVLGGARYKDLLPPKSYINILDFQSPRVLASYLKALDTNQNLYSRYFQWKTNHVIYSSLDSVTDGFCQLCNILHDPFYPRQIYLDVEKWMKKRCDNKFMSRMMCNW